VSLTVETAAGGAFEDADDATLERLVMAMNPDNEYLILHRSDLDEEEFAQTSLEHSPDASLVKGSFVIEYRDGPNSQWQAKATDRAKIYETLAGWPSTVRAGRTAWCGSASTSVSETTNQARTRGRSGLSRSFSVVLAGVLRRHQFPCVMGVSWMALA
jgi:hypothetical protein